MTYESNETSAVTISHATLERLAAIARGAGQLILAHADSEYEVKTDGSPVTRADRVAGDHITAALTAWDPDIPIVSEEAPLTNADVRRAWGRFWLVDPLDGTKEFLAGSAEYTVNIALIENRAPVLGVVAAPALDVIYYAGSGLGSWRRVGQHEATGIFTTPPGSDRPLRIVESRSHPSPQMNLFLRSLAVAERIGMGSSLKFCRLAEGLADCYPRLGPTMAWDVAAGDCIFRYATAIGEPPHPSALTYDPLDFRQPAFVIGFAPPEAVERVLTANDSH